MDTLVDKQVKIRKEQRCFGCARPFEKGTTLRYLKQVDGGVFLTSYWCQTCDAYWEKFMRGYGMEIGYGELRIEDKEGWETIRKSVEEQEVSV